MTDIVATNNSTYEKWKTWQENETLWLIDHTNWEGKRIFSEMVTELEDATVVPLDELMPWLPECCHSDCEAKAVLHIGGATFCRPHDPRHAHEMYPLDIRALIEGERNDNARSD